MEEGCLIDGGAGRAGGGEGGVGGEVRGGAKETGEVIAREREKVQCWDKGEMRDIWKR